MKKLLLLLLFSTLFNAQSTMPYKTLTLQAENSSSSAKQMIQMAQEDYKKTKKPIYLALNGLGNFFMAKHSFNPFNKMSYFKEGKEQLDQAIQLEPNNLEMRFLRLVSQSKLPKLLGYYQNIEEDRKFLTKNYNNTNDLVLKNEIKTYLSL